MTYDQQFRQQAAGGSLIPWREINNLLLSATVLAAQASGVFSAHSVKETTMHLLNAFSENQLLKNHLAKWWAAPKLARRHPGKDSPLWRASAVTLIFCRPMSL